MTIGNRICGTLRLLPLHLPRLPPLRSRSYDSPLCALARALPHRRHWHLCHPCYSRREHRTLSKSFHSRRIIASPREIEKLVSQSSPSTARVYAKCSRRDYTALGNFVATRIICIILCINASGESLYNWLARSIKTIPSPPLNSFAISRESTSSLIESAMDRFREAL